MLSGRLDAHARDRSEGYRCNILKYLKVEGAPLRKDELLFELETDKAIVEAPSGRWRPAQCS
jgi:hypothetical protein